MLKRQAGPNALRLAARRSFWPAFLKKGGGICAQDDFAIWHANAIAHPAAQMANMPGCVRRHRAGVLLGKTHHRTRACRAYDGVRPTVAHTRAAALWPADRKRAWPYIPHGDNQRVFPPDAHLFAVQMADGDAG